MMNILVALAAGCAAGLMFASVKSGVGISIVLAYLAPLPLMVAALGWGPGAALIGGLSAGVGFGLFNLVHGLGFVLTVALPAFWLGHLSLLARPATEPSLSSANRDPRLDWYPIGRVVLWAAAIAALSVMIFILLMTGNSAEEITIQLRDAFLRPLNAVNQDLSEEDKERIALFVARVFPSAAVSTTTLMYLLNLWLAGRIARTSNRLRRPWPELRNIELPQIAIAVLAAALLLSFAGGLLAILAQIVAGALLTAYTLVGFAVLHAVTQGGRWWWRISAYGLIILLVWPILFVPMLGLLDAAIGLRRRFANTAGPPTLSS